MLVNHFTTAQNKAMEVIKNSQAVKLKDAGYKNPCNQYYLSGNTRIKKPRTKQDWNEAVNSYSAPYLDEVIDWLDEKGVFISVTPTIERDFTVQVYISPRGLDYELEWEWEMRGIPSRTLAKFEGIDRSLNILLSKQINK